MTRTGANLAILVFLLALIAATVLLTGPPSSLPASASPDRFSADRALAYLREFARQPHPVGTPEHDRVRDYLLAQLSTLGLSPEVQRDTGVTPIYEVAGRVENILARRKGTAASADAILLASHYDSVPSAPGAGDDGAGVAALLETLRALNAGPPLKNDLIFLFSDAEEEGLLGASAFVADHPWAKDVRVALNFEGRGNAGSSTLFETTPGNGRLVQIFASATPVANGSSLGYEIYKHLPNDTDMTSFKKSGMAGLNFAFIGHWEAYHTPLDTPDGLDRGSLQQHGEIALSLARSLGNADLAQLSSRDATFFGLPGHFFHYSSSRIWPFTAVALLLFAAVAIFADSAYPVGFFTVLGSVLANLFSMAVLMGAAFGFFKLVTWLHLKKLPEGDVLRSVPYALALLASLAALELFLVWLVRRKLDWHSFFLGTTLCIAIFSVLLAVWLPGADFVLLWPLFAMLVASIFLGADNQESGTVSRVVVLILSLPAALLFSVLLQNFFLALGLSPVGAPVLGLALFLFLAVILPLCELLLASTPALVPGLLFIASLLFFALGAYTTRYSTVHPKPSMMLYALDADSAKAVWASSARRADPWTSQFVGANPVAAPLQGFLPAFVQFPFLQHEAASLALAPPQISLLETSSAGDIRDLRLRLSSPRGARQLTISAPENEILDATADDHRLALPADSRWNQHGKWELTFANPPSDGIELRLHAKGIGPVKFVIVDNSIGLPAIPGSNLPPRPADSMPHHSGDQTLVRRTFVF